MPMHELHHYHFFNDEMSDQPRVLLVEDNPVDAELELRILNTTNGRNTVVLRDGAEALDYFYRDDRPAGELPWVIFLDLKLPKIQGIDVLKKIKSDERLKTIPVVVLTSSNEDTDIRSCYDCGANSYIVKPIAYNDFRSVLSTTCQYWLNRNQHFLPA